MVASKSQSWQVIEKQPEELRDADFEPATRLKDDKSLRRLRESIREKGVLIPIMIREDGTIIDGHRRVKCAKDIGLGQVPVVVIDGDIASLFRELNDTRKQVTGAQWMDGYTRGADVPERIRSKIEALQVIVGREGIERLVSLGVSPVLYNVVRRTAAYCDRGDDILFQAEVIYWVTEYHQALHLHRALRDFVSPEIILQAVEEGRELVAKWDLGV